MDEEGNNVLHIAAANGYDLPSSSFNIDDINCQNYFGWTPLMYSAYHGHEFLVNKLLSLGADVRMKNDFGAAVITLAAASGKVDVIRSGMKADKITTEFDFTSPLAIATVLGHLSVTRYLIDHGFDPNSAMPSSGVTPLMLAVCQNHIEVVKLLIERDVCISSINIAGYSALDLALLKGNKEIISILHEKAGKYLDINPDNPYTSDEEMSLAAKSGNLLSLRNQLSKNFLTDTFYLTDMQNFSNMWKSNDKKCGSPLPENLGYSGDKRRNLKCIKNTNFERFNEISMQINVAAGSGDNSEKTSSHKDIDINSRIKGKYAIENEKVNNALMAACLGGHMEAVYLLLAAGANPNYEQKGRTPLMVAVTGSQLEITKLLLSVGADPKQLSSKDYLSAFELATLSGASTELTRLLASCTLQPSISDANEVCQLLNFSEPDRVSSPFDKIKRFKFKSPKGSSHLKPNKFLWNQLNEKESRKVLSPYRCKLLGSSNSRGSSYPWGQLVNNDKQNLKTQSDHTMRSRRPPLSEMDISQLPFPSDTPFRQLPSDSALSLRLPLFIPDREVNRVVQKKSFNEMEDTPNEAAITTTDIPVKILNLI